MKSKLSKLAAALLLMIAAAVPLRAAENWEAFPLGSTFESGSGTRYNPYVIHTAQQLFNFAYMVYESMDYFENCYIILDRDIVLNDDVIANPSAAKAWMPIGKWGLFKDGKFLGSFDGRGHTIYGLYISKDSQIEGYAGLFGTVKKNGEVKNLNVKDAVIDLSSYSNGNLYVGGIVGYTTDNAAVTNCTFEGNIYGNERSRYQGGIVGFHTSSNPILSCQFTGSVGAKPKDNAYCPGCAGGIAGYSSGSIVDCTATVNALGSLNISDGYLGGIVGCGKSMVVNCVTNSTDADGNNCIIQGVNVKNVGGIAGWAQQLSHCRNYAAVQTDHASLVLGGVAGSCNTVEYSANFGRVYCVNEDYTRTINVVYMGGVTGQATDVKNCANYGAVDIPDMQWSKDNGADFIYTHCGGIAGYSPKITGSFNVGKVRYAFFNYRGSWKIHSYGVSRNMPGSHDNTYYLYTTPVAATAEGDGGMKAEIGALQSESLLQIYEGLWGMKWGIEQETKYPLPIKWGGVSREYAIYGMEGDGTEANPFKIVSADMFMALNNGLKYSDTNLAGKYFKQVCDLDFKGINFTPMGMYYDNEKADYVYKSFKGHYDGGGYTVRNIDFIYLGNHYPNAGNKYIGFISKLEDEGSLSNINFVNVNIIANDRCCAGIAAGGYSTKCEPVDNMYATAPQYTPFSGINVLACSIVSHGGSQVGGIVGATYTDVYLDRDEMPYEMNQANITIEGCTVQNTSIEASHIAGGIVGMENYTNISHSTAMCDFSMNATSDEPCYIGGLIGSNHFSEYGNDVISFDSNVIYCTVSPNVDYDSVDKANKECYIGGYVGTCLAFSELTLSNSMSDFSRYAGDHENVFTGYCSGYDWDAYYCFYYVEFPDESSEWLLCGNRKNEDLDIAYDAEYKRFSELGGWSAYYLNGNSNDGDMKWGYYYPTASPNPYPVTSANSRYSHYDLTGTKGIAAPDRLYVDFTLSAIPLDNNVLIAADGAAIDQVMIAAKANLVSQNGVASRLYLYDKMDFTYPGSFHSYAVHYENEDADTWQVMCLPFELKLEMLPEGCKMFAVGGYANGAASGDEIEVAAAGEPFILYNEGGFVIDDYAYNGGITGSITAGTYLTGTFTAATASVGDYVLSADGTKFVRLTEETPIDAFRGYVPASKFADGGAEVPFNAVITGIEDKAGNAHRASIYADGEAIVIESSENGTAVIYSASGALVKQIDVIEGNRTAIPLATGIYFVKLGTTTAKVIVR